MRVLLPVLALISQVSAKHDIKAELGEFNKLADSLRKQAKKIHDSGDSMNHESEAAMLRWKAKEDSSKHAALLAIDENDKQFDFLNGAIGRMVHHV